MKVLKFNESELTLGELERDSKSGGRRGDVLVKKIQNNDELKTIKNRKEIIVQNSDEVISQITDDEGNYDPELAKDYFKRSPSRYREDALKGDDGQDYKLNDLEKTADFGSTRGSGLGAVDTRYVEAIQCIFFAYRQRKRMPLEDGDVKKLISLSDNTLERIKRFIDIGDIKIDRDIISKFEKDWTPTFVNIANVIYQPGSANSGFKNDLLINPRRLYKFCQISSNDGIVKAIKDKFKSYNKKVSMAKWNPSDVWAIDTYTEKTIIQQINDCDTFADFNNIINSLFDEKKLIGISLKKVGSKEDVKLIINKLTKIPIYKFESVKVAEDSLSTIGVKISARSYSEFGEDIAYMSFRSSGGPDKIENIQGEVQGKMARHGKISLTMINKILVEVLSSVEGAKVETVISATSEEYYDENLSKWTNRQLINEIDSINNKIIRKYGDVTSSRLKEVGLNRSRLISKYQSLFLAWILMENQNVPYNRLYSVSDKIVGLMFQYALSINLTGKKSGRTPKYARIVD
jgi:hypothetical protein